MGWRACRNAQRRLLPFAFDDLSDRAWSMGSVQWVQVLPAAEANTDFAERCWPQIPVVAAARSLT
jgi:hypothetical protein